MLANFVPSFSDLFPVVCFRSPANKPMIKFEKSYAKINFTFFGPNFWILELPLVKTHNQF